MFKTINASEARRLTGVSIEVLKNELKDDIDYKYEMARIKKLIEITAKQGEFLLEYKFEKVSINDIKIKEIIIDELEKVGYKVSDDYYTSDGFFTPILVIEW